MGSRVTTAYFSNWKAWTFYPSYCLFYSLSFCSCVYVEDQHEKTEEVLFLAKMNLFLLSRYPRLAAYRHCDKHVVKMILEATQMLYTAWGDEPAPCPKGMKPYRRTHVNHPTSRWVRARKEHYMFTCTFALCLCEEYTKRYGRTHACEIRIRHLRRSIPPMTFRERGVNDKIARSGLPKGITWFPLAMPEDCLVKDETGELNAVRSYKRYYGKKRNTMDMKWNRTTYKRPTKNTIMTYKRCES